MKRISVEKEIKYISNVIEKNICYYKRILDKGFLSENILSQLRNLVEDVAILVNNKSNNKNLDTNYENISPSIEFLKGKPKYKFILEFYDFLRGTASHYTPNEDGAERLVCFYFRYICLIKELLFTDYNIEIIKNLEEFPIYDDVSMKENYDIIARKVEEISSTRIKYVKGKFYVQKCTPRFSKGKTFYELTLTKATDYTNKFERITMYSKIFIPDYYSVNISCVDDIVELNVGRTKIKVINSYKVAIRVCELKNLFRVIGVNNSFDDRYKEYNNLMNYLTETQFTINEILTSGQKDYDEIVNKLKIGADNHVITDCFTSLREIIMSNRKGANVLKYLTTKIENIVIRDQLSDTHNIVFEDVYIDIRCGMFEAMPFAMSLYKHNTSWMHLIKVIDLYDREDELLYKTIKSNIDNDNILYTPISELNYFNDIDSLIEKFKNKLLKSKRNSDGYLVSENGYVYIKSYEKVALNIVEKLDEYANATNDSIKEMLDLDLLFEEHSDISGDKKNILDNILRNSSLAFLYGSAGTGKTKMIEILSKIFSNYNKYFISTTNTAVSNLKNRMVGIANCTFKNIEQFKQMLVVDCDILFIDESSMVNNDDILAVLNKAIYKAIIIVGDISQIESIKYGNWFNLCKRYYSNKIVFELSETHRTTEEELLNLWSAVRNNDKKAITIMSNQEYSEELSDNVFIKNDEEEIVLCLNYDGMYGINNINKIIQNTNPNPEINIGVDTYKIDDPILFNDCPRFKDIFYNNLKGFIRDIVVDDKQNCTWFTIEIDENSINSMYSQRDVEFIECDVPGKVFVKFFVNEYKDKDNDENEYNHIIPFNLAYATSIHKAQGLEYNSVKVVITPNVEDRITKNIFYTAITRAKNKLKVYWSSDSQMKIFDSFAKKDSIRDIAIFRQKMKSRI